jgi:putative glutathione S-transferase
MGASEIHKYGTDDGWHGKIEEGGVFPPARNRYHLYIGEFPPSPTPSSHAKVLISYTGLFCPFAHRVNLVRHLKRLTDIISVSVVRPYPKDGGGWRFPASNDEYPNATVDHLFGSNFLSEVYFKDDAEYKGKYSVPLLWDKKTGRIVNNVGEIHGQHTRCAEQERWTEC